MITRRGFLGVLTGIVAAPIVVRAELIMPVKALVLEPSQTTYIYHRITYIYSADAFSITRDDVLAAAEHAKMIFPSHGLQIGDTIRISVPTFSVPA